MRGEGERMRVASAAGVRSNAALDNSVPQNLPKLMRFQGKANELKLPKEIRALPEVTDIRFPAIITSKWC